MKMKNGTDLANEANRKLQNDWRTAHRAWCNRFSSIDFGVSPDELVELYWSESEKHDRVCGGCSNKEGE